MMIRQIKETCLYVRNLDITSEFYSGKLDLPVIGKVENRHIFFRAGTSVLLCFLPEVTREDKSLPPHYGYGPVHLAFEVDFPEYEAWKERITKAGIEIIQEQSWGKSFKSFYFRDPDEHLLEIVPAGMWGT